MREALQGLIAFQSNCPKRPLSLWSSAESIAVSGGLTVGDRNEIDSREGVVLSKDACLDYMILVPGGLLETGDRLIPVPWKPRQQDLKRTR
jgi:hypothetical protein